MNRGANVAGLLLANHVAALWAGKVLAMERLRKEIERMEMSIRCQRTIAFTIRSIFPFKKSD